MRVLLDTNLLIGREDPKVLDEALAKLLQLFAENGVTVLVHPRSVEELSHDRNEARREMILSKVRAYPRLGHPPPTSHELEELAGAPATGHDAIDLELLQAVRSNAVSFFITEDQDLIRRAARVELSDRVLNIHVAIQTFEALYGRIYPETVPYIQRSFVHTLDPNDPFFDSFREDYPGFNEWLAKAARAGRLCYKSTVENGRLGSILILKDTDREPICGLPPIPRMKICTLKVAAQQSGFRLGESLVDLAIEYATANRAKECFVTVFPKYGELVGLLTTFGFEARCTQPNGEQVLVKSLDPPLLRESVDPMHFLRAFYPYFRDDPSIRKFLVPIRPPYHALLFPERGTRGIQMNLDGGAVLAPAAGNAVRKAYLSNAVTKQVRPGDVLLFYRSVDRQAITHAGVVEETRICRTPTEILDFVGNRTVLHLEELERLCARPVISLLFWATMKLNPEISLQELYAQGRVWPQSISEIPHDQYRVLIHRPAGPG